MHSCTQAMEMNFVFQHRLGPIRACITQKGLAALVLPEPGLVLADKIRTAECPYAKKLAKALERYFSGNHESFESIELDLVCGTPFQRAVWEATRDVRWGEVTTYGEIARRIGKNCPRAVGQALGANPVPVVVPCHRVLAAGGALGGFSCGLEWKRELLGLEGTL